MEDKKFCKDCGAEIARAAEICPKCGVRQVAVAFAKVEGASSKSRTAASLLCFFLGVLGVHRFYVGKIGTGILWLLTLGLLGIGELIDFIMILSGKFKDKQGKYIINW